MQRFIFAAAAIALAMVATHPAAAADKSKRYATNHSTDISAKGTKAAAVYWTTQINNARGDGGGGGQG